MESRIVSIVVPARCESFDTVRRVLLAFLSPSVDEDTRIRLGICLGEGFNNAVAHAVGDTEGRIEVGIAVGANEIVLDVADAGVRMTEEARARLATAEIPDPTGVPLQEIQARGVGFGSLLGFLDDVGYTSRDGFNILRMIKRLDSPRPAR